MVLNTDTIDPRFLGRGFNLYEGVGGGGFHFNREYRSTSMVLGKTKVKCHSSARN